MTGISLDELHHLIDQTEETIRDIEALPNGILKIEQMTDLSFIILEVSGFSNTAYFENDLGIAPSHLTKFVKMRGTIKKHDALAIANRVRSYLKSQDQLTVQREPAPSLADAKHTQRPEKSARMVSTPSIVIVAEQWVAVRTDSEIKRSISLISTLLENIIEQTKGSNAPSEQQPLSELDRKQLIAILETALNLLKSPLVEKGLLKKAKETLETAGKKAAEKGMQEGLGKLMSIAGKKLGELFLLWLKIS